MSTLRIFFKVLLVGFVAAAFFACAAEELPGVCQNQSDCDPGFFCGPDHQCLCDKLKEKEACAVDEFCNAQGHCQKIQGCRTAQDCPKPDYMRCEIQVDGRGNCLCMKDEACDVEAGEFCNNSGNCQKKAGCIVAEDCVTEKGVGTADDWECRINPDTRVGECRCKTQAVCKEGEFCNPQGFCQPSTSCKSIKDCPPGRKCNVDTGECLCEDETGCAPDEVCNQSGYCQPRPGCFDNRDCAHLENHYCDYTTKKCVPETECSADRQCPLEQVCRQSKCVEGCNGDGDCPLDKYCGTDNKCTAGCQDELFCDFIEYCVNGSCEEAYSEQAPYCKPCVGTDLLGCGSRDNLCLVYPYLDDEFAQLSEEYCAPDCAGGKNCPKGFSCSSVITIKPGNAPQGDLCTGPGQCARGLPCLKSPEEDQGYCPCHPQYNPCPENTCLEDTCGTITKKCVALAIAGVALPCTGPDDCKVCTVTLKNCASTECAPVECELEEGQAYGGCVIAKTCGLEEGYHCPVPPAR